MSISLRDSVTGNDKTFKTSDDSGEARAHTVIDSGTVGHDTTGLGHGVKAVASAGTDEALVAVSTPAKWVIVQAQAANTGQVAIGGAGVDADAAGTGLILTAGQTVTLKVDDLADVYVDATENGEGVRFTYGT